MSGSRRRTAPSDSLLNFSYPLPAVSAENGFRRGPLRPAVRFNKKRHVRANFRFALSSESDDVNSSIEFVDDPIDWDKVLLVNQLVEHPPYCPICLDVLVAPRITKCGHSSCLKCILHYFSLSQRNYARCVLCAEPVYVGDLRCFTFDVHPVYKTKDNVTFVLCRRAGASSEVFPVAPIVANSPFQFQSIIVGFDLDPVYRKEYDDIINALLTAEQDEIPYFQMALDCVEKLMASPTQAVTTSIRNLSPSLAEPVKATDRDHYFYQSLDGQLLFLNSLSFRCLLHEYGSVDSLPVEITAPILDIVRVRQTESLRSKFRFIAHLPITTNYCLCDLKLKPLVTKSTLAHFREDFQQQAKVHSRQKALQKRDERKMEVINREREKELLQRSRHAIPMPNNNPFLLADLDDFGPAIGNAKPSLKGPTVGAWSIVADKGLMASEAWEPLPSRPGSQASLVTADCPQTSLMAASKPAASFSSVVSSQATQPFLKPSKTKQPTGRQTLLFSNAGNRQYKS